MNEFVAKLVAKTGISEEQATKVVAFVKEHKDDIPGWLAKAGVKDAVADKLPGGLGGLLG